MPVGNPSDRSVQSSSERKKNARVRSKHWRNNLLVLLTATQNNIFTTVENQSKMLSYHLLESRDCIGDARSIRTSVREDMESFGSE